MGRFMISEFGTYVGDGVSWGSDSGQREKDEERCRLLAEAREIPEEGIPVSQLKEGWYKVEGPCAPRLYHFDGRVPESARLFYQKYVRKTKDMPWYAEEYRGVLEDIQTRPDERRGGYVQGYARVPLKNLILKFDVFPRLYTRNEYSSTHVNVVETVEEKTQLGNEYHKLTIKEEGELSTRSSLRSAVGEIKG